MKQWLTLKQESRYVVMYYFRNALTRQCFQKYLSTLKNVRRLWKWAKAVELSERSNRV